MSNETTSPAYVLALINVSDREGFKAYQQKIGPTLKPFGGKPIAMSWEPVVLEGEWQQGLSLVIQFPSHEAAQNWYDSEENTAVVPLRHKAAVASHLAIVDGV